MKVCFGGTFNILHKGHELLFEKAFEGDNDVFIGLTTDELIRGIKTVDIDNYETRKRNLEKFLNDKGWKGRYEILPLEDTLGPAVRKDFDAIVVSQETISGAEKINSERERNGLKPLEILTVEMALADNGEVISSTRIKKGEIDVNGKLMRRVAIFVGSENPVKITAAENVFAKLFRRVQVKGKKVRTEVPQQPKEEEVIEGALQRAKGALDEGIDFGVGIEAGLFWNESVGEYFDVQYCVVIDRSGRTTLGHGSGFIYPPTIIDLVKDGMTVGEAMHKIYGIEDIGKKMGAIGYLSRELLDRTRLTEQAVLMAMIPRIRSDIYDRKKK